MSERLDIQRISAYLCALMLVVAGGTLVLAALGGSTGGDPATVIAEPSQRSVSISTDIGSEQDDLLESKSAGMGITPVRGTNF